MHDAQTDKALLSVAETAKLLGVTRIAIFKRIRSGKLKAEKVGRNYVIHRSSVELPSVVLPEQNEEIKRVVRKAVKEYGETFRRLGREE